MTTLLVVFRRFALLVIQKPGRISRFSVAKIGSTSALSQLLPKAIKTLIHSLFDRGTDPRSKLLTKAANKIFGSSDFYFSNFG